MKTLILDNYDSFTYNLMQYVAEIGGNPVVYRNDALTLEDVRDLAPSHVILSPGPGNPSVPRDIGISEELLDSCAKEGIPLLGVCLGHQTLGRYFGATVCRAPRPYHGKSSPVTLGESPLFAGLGPVIEAMRYHSLCVQEDTIPPVLRITARSDDNLVMGLQHVSLPLYGVQFHPESVGTPAGKALLGNFLGQ